MLMYLEFSLKGGEGVVIVYQVKECIFVFRVVILGIVENILGLRQGNVEVGGRELVRRVWLQFKGELMNVQFIYIIDIGFRNY